MLPNDIMAITLSYFNYFTELDSIIERLYDEETRKYIKKKIYYIKLVKEEKIIYEVHKSYASYQMCLPDKNYYLSEAYYVDEFPHREDDLPATIVEGTYKTWRIGGKVHRNHLPAHYVDHGAKSMAWMQNNKYHREGDKPAFYNKFDASIDGELCLCIIIEWFVNGKLHRDIGPAKIQQSLRDGRVKTRYFYYKLGEKYKSTEIYYGIPLIENDEYFD